MTTRPRACAQQPLGLVERLLPRHGLEAAPADALQRLAEPVLGAQVRVREAALVADPALVDLGVVAGEDPLDLALAHRRVDVAADGTEAADGRHVDDLPRPPLEAVLRRQQRADRAELGDVAGERARVGQVLEGRDHGHRAAVGGDELAVLRDALAEARAAVAEDAALAVERDRGRDRDRLLEGQLLEAHPRVAGPVAEGEVLQRALAALVADRAVERVVDEDELERRVLPLRRLLGRARRLHDHPVLRGERAAGLELRHPLDLDEAHAAGADRRAEARLVTEDGDLDPGRERRLDQPRPLRDVDVALVDRDAHELGAHTSASSDDGRVRVLVDRREQPRELRVGAERAAAVLEVLAELVAELRHAARDRHRGRVAEHAEALADDPVADVERQLEVALGRGSLLDRAHQLDEPARADAARRALAARLVHVELRDPQRELDDARPLVDHRHDARADEVALLAERVGVERRVEVVRRHHRERRAAHHHGLERVAVRDAAADVVDQVPHRDPVRRLVHAGPLDVAREAEEARAGRVGRRADLRVLLRADGEDRRDRRDRLDVVDQRRRRVDAGDGRERRLRARLPALPFERLEQGGLLAADVGAGAAVDRDLDLAEDARVARLVERALQGLVLREVLAADVDVDLLRLDRVRRDQAALEQPVRDLEHDLAVLERPRLGLVGVDGDVDRLRDLVGRRDEARLAAGREERAAAAAEVRLDHLLDHGLRILARAPSRAARSRRPRGTTSRLRSGSPS